ncbi:MAG TPA: hypothetical protein VL049_22435 [Candidatus Dormibacteraeota bacterium]|nr:hypothetical protein [Candidatus Dormibacteraeota bacterium]
MSSTPHEAHPVHAHQEDEIVLRPVVIAGLGLLVFVAITGAAMFGLYHVLAREEARLSPPANPLAAAEGPRMPPEPRLQTHPLKDLEELRQAETEQLTTYGWVDKSAGTVRIPIDRAIDILAERAGNAGAPKP